MPTTLLVEAAASLSQLKNNSMAYEVLMDKLEDTKLAAIVESRKCQAEIAVAWDEFSLSTHLTALYKLRGKA